MFGDNNQVSASDTYDKLIDLPADLENLVRQRSLVNSDDFDNDAPHQSYQDQDWWTLEEPPQVDDSLIGIELVDNGDFETGLNRGPLSGMVRLPRLRMVLFLEPRVLL